MSSLESHLGYWLRLVSNQVSEAFRKRVETQGVSVSEWVALRNLYEHERMSPAALAVSVAMTKGAVSKIVARLESAGHLRREGDATDGRAQWLSLTRQGRALVPKLARLADENDHHFFGMLAASDRAQLERALRDIASTRELSNVPVD